MEESEWIQPWGDGMGFGIPELNAAELRLNALAHELNQAIADGREADELQRLMNQILLEADSHFEHEEHILSQSAYPSPKGHAALHRQMRAELEHAREEFRNVQTHAIRAEYGLLVAQLFVEHMRQEAMKYRNSGRSSSLSDPQGT